MFQRKAYDKLLEWKSSANGRSAVLIEGARRVGKTTLAAEFGQREYRSHILIDFTATSKSIKGYFEDFITDLDTFFLYLQAETGVELVPRQSLIIFDEVQAFPLARQSIKHLVADGRFDYIETGSLISLRKNVEAILIPSEEHALRLDPLDFEEFLWARDERPLAQIITQSSSSLTPLPDDLHQKALRLFREYMLVGGMPQAVDGFVESSFDLDRVEAIKRDILSLYRNDIAKFAGASAARVRQAFDSIPAQLSRKNKRFTFARLGHDVRSDDLENAFDWLDDAFIVNRCFHCSDPSIDLASTADPTNYKCYLADTGLLVSLAFPQASIANAGVMASVLNGRLSINEGMLTENVIAQCLRASGWDLYYWSSYDERMKRSYEVDYLVPSPYGKSGRMRVSPVEVKSGRRFGTRSLNVFESRYKNHQRVGQPFIFAPKQLAVPQKDAPHSEPVILPLYMAGFLHQTLRCY